MKSLQVKIMLIVSALIIVSEGILGYSMYRSSSQLLLESIGKQAQNIANYAVDEIDIDAYSELTPESGETDYYFRLRERLNELREANRLKYLYTMNMRDKDGAKEYFYVVDGVPADAAPEEVSALGTIEGNRDADLEAAFATGQPQVGSLATGEEYGTTLTTYVPIKDKSGGTIGVLGADFDASQLREQMNRNRDQALELGGIVLALSLAVLYAVSRMIVSPLLKLTREMQNVESGDLTSSLTDSRQDEIGQLSRAFRSMLDTMREMITGVRSGAQHTRRSAEALSDSAEEWADASGRMAVHLGEAGQNIRDQARLSEENLQALSEIGGGIRRLADALNVVSVAAGEASGTASDGRTFVVGALNQMEAVQASSNETKARVEQLSIRSNRIGEIVGEIQAISSQTNLLALNASIEAARAGEHGRGFAVVAGEVRRLAEQADKSASDVAGIVAGIIEETHDVAEGVRVQDIKIDEAVGAVKQTGDSFGGILTSIERIAQQLQEVSRVSEQTAAGAQQAAITARQMEESSQSTALHFSGIEQSAEGQLAAIEGMKDSAAELKRMSAELERMIGRFKVDEEREAAFGGGTAQALGG